MDKLERIYAKSRDLVEREIEGEVKFGSRIARVYDGEKGGR